VTSWITLKHGLWTLVVFSIHVQIEDVYSSEEEKNEENTSEESECEEREDVYVHEGKLLMIRRTLTNQPIPQTES